MYCLIFFENREIFTLKLRFTWRLVEKKSLHSPSFFIFCWISKINLFLKTTCVCCNTLVLFLPVSHLFLKSKDDDDPHTDEFEDVFFLNAFSNMDEPWMHSFNVSNNQNCWKIFEMYHHITKIWKSCQLRKTSQWNFWEFSRYCAPSLYSKPR